VGRRGARKIGGEVPAEVDFRYAVGGEVLGALARTNARARQETEQGAGRSAGDGGTVPIATPIDGVQELPSTVKVTPQCSCASTGSVFRARTASLVRSEGDSAGAATMATTCVSSPCSAHRKCRTVISCEIDSSWATIAAANTATVSDLAAAEAL
jgi:hypothetical protein